MKCWGIWLRRAPDARDGVVPGCSRNYTECGGDSARFFCRFGGKPRRERRFRGGVLCPIPAESAADGSEASLWSPRWARLRRERTTETAQKTEDFTEKAHGPAFFAYASALDAFWRRARRRNSTPTTHFSETLMRKFLQEFQAFISRGNVLDLAVAVITGAAFTNIINSLIKDIVEPRSWASWSAARTSRTSSSS